MAEVQLDVKNADFLGTNFPQYNKVNGTNIPVAGLGYDDTADEAAFWRISARNYSSTLAVEVEWYADNATSGVVRWGVSVAAITPNTDTQDIETDGLSTEVTSDDTHLGTTGQRLHSISIGSLNVDSLAADDDLVIRIRRIGSNAADTMANDAILTKAVVTWTDA